MTTRRSVFENLKEPFRATQITNPGLWFDKFIWSVEEADKESKRNLVRQVCTIPPSEEYAAFYTRWKQTLSDFGAVTGEATVNGRMAVGLGTDSVLETSVMLHRTYGVPFIPGSALKGLAAHYCRNYLGFSEQWGVTKDEKDRIVAVGDAYKVVFGDTDDAGYITFFDALYVPDSGFKNKPLYPDVMTPHHSDYYGDEGQPPADWDNPTPVPFISATGSYLIALGGEEKWVAAVFQILKKALAMLGVGAKTSSGYGRLQLDLATLKKSEPPQPPVDPEQAQADELIQKISAVRETDVSHQLGPLANQISTFQSAMQRSRIAFALSQKIRVSGWKKAKEKAWYQVMLDNLNR